MEPGLVTMYSGRKLRPLAWDEGGLNVRVALRPEDVDIRDIARSNAMTCRFNGQLRDYYDVAHHCWRVSHILEGLGHTSGACLAGLLHDGGEPYLHDVIAPLKALYCIGGRAFEAVELEMLEVVFRALYIPWPIPEVVFDVDRELCETERREYQTGGDLDGESWTWFSSEDRYLERFHELQRARGVVRGEPVEQW